jgi:hypothetical protein
MWIRWILVWNQYTRIGLNSEHELDFDRYDFDSPKAELIVELIVSTNVMILINLILLLRSDFDSPAAVRLS